MKTRLLIVDDSPLIRAILREVFERTPDMEVVGEAGDGKRAVELVRDLRPDIVTMDVVMPVMDGLAATEEIMRSCPTPIVIVARAAGDTRGLAIQALGKGALAVFPKPAVGFDDQQASVLSATIRTIAQEARTRPATFEPQVVPGARIRVLLVDDSPLVRQRMREGLSRMRDIEVVAEAAEGATAVKLAVEFSPDVVCLDMLMPIMGGQETAQRMLRQVSPAILLVTRDEQDARRLLERLGADTPMEIFLKPESGFREQQLADLASAIRRLAMSARSSSASSAMLPRQRKTPVHPGGSISVVGIVGSSGAPRVLHDIVRALPRDFPVPLVVVQHTERGYTEALAAWLAEVAALPVRLGQSEEVLSPGEIVVAPDNMHMEIHTGGLVRLDARAPVEGFRPSGTVLLKSLAATFGQHALGLVLSGMGRDGADGLGDIDAAGGCALVEDPETAAVPGMPKRALEKAPGAHVESALGLSSLLANLVKAGGSS